MDYCEYDVMEDEGVHEDGGVDEDIGDDDWSSHWLFRLSPTQLTVPFDSTLLEGAFAGVNFPLSI